MNASRKPPAVRLAQDQSGSSVDHGHDFIGVAISGRLEFSSWRLIQQARDIAARHQLPLHIDLSNCKDADMAGVATLVIAQERVKEVDIAGCSHDLAYFFRQFSICSGCGSKKHQSCPHCKTGESLYQAALA